MMNKKQNKIISFINQQPCVCAYRTSSFHFIALHHVPHELLPLTRWGRDKMAAIFQTTFPNAFSSMKSFCISIRISLHFVPESPIDIKPAMV